MVIRGILDRSLSNQLCIRGFAPIKQLARISKADYSYQRDLYAEQEDIVKKFLEKERYLFFPEIILSYKFKHIGDVNTNPFRLVKDFTRQGTSFSASSNYDRTKIRAKKQTYRSSDIRGIDSIQLIELEINDDDLTGLIASDDHPFHRIDGNHRLTVAENSDSPIVENMTVPFCIILGEQYFNRQKQIIESEESLVFDKSIRVYFHNINTKTLPLTSEQNLSLILNKQSNFSDEEILDVFPESGLQIRELLTKLNEGYFSGIRHIIEGKFLELLDCLFTVIYDYYNKIQPIDIVQKTIEALKTVEQEYKKSPKLNGNNNEGLFITLIFYCIKDKKQYAGFLDWIINNHLFDVSETKAETLIKIYDKIYERKVYKLFVAMPYYSHAQVNEYNKLFKEICAEVSKKAKVELELIPIMRFRGESQRIDKRLIDMIQSCDIFIADISTNNLNVIFEVGYAEARDIPIFLIKQENDPVPPPFDMDKLQYLPFPEKGYYNDIKAKLVGNLVETFRNHFHIQI